jgi:hypothetical protein
MIKLNGYDKIKISKKLHNEYLICYQIKWYTFLFYNYKYFISNEEVRIYKYLSLFSKILCIILMPIYIVYYGINDIKKLFKEYYDLMLDNTSAVCSLDLYYNDIETNFHIDLNKENGI